MRSINAIEIHNMRTAIHEIYPIKCRPKTTVKLFRLLEWIQEDPDHFLKGIDSKHREDEYEWLLQDVWDRIAENTEEGFEIDYHYVEGCGAFFHGVPISPRWYIGIYEVFKYNIIGYFDIWV